MLENSLDAFDLRGGGLLDFLISAPELIPSMQSLKENPGFLRGLSNGVVDAYENSFPFLYRILTLNSWYNGEGDLDNLVKMPSHIRNSDYYVTFKKIHANTLKIIKAWQELPLC
jgi:hypothetical protein